MVYGSGPHMLVCISRFVLDKRRGFCWLFRCGVEPILREEGPCDVDGSARRN